MGEINHINLLTIGHYIYLKLSSIVDYTNSLCFNISN